MAMACPPSPLPPPAAPTDAVLATTTNAAAAAAEVSASAIDSVRTARAGPDLPPPAAAPAAAAPEGLYAPPGDGESTSAECHAPLTPAPPPPPPLPLVTQPPPLPSSVPYTDSLGCLEVPLVLGNGRAPGPEECLVAREAGVLELEGRRIAAHLA